MRGPRASEVAAPPRAWRRHARAGLPRAVDGFSLVELIIVIVVLGILSGAVAVFINSPVRAYVDSQRRAALTDAADHAVRRLLRDLQGAVPNSVRITTSGGSVFVEFTPMAASGRYRAAVSGGNEPAGSNPLDFGDASDSSFQILGDPLALPAGAQLVIFNLGAGEFDLYGGSNRRPVTTGAGSVATLAFSAGAHWPAASPDQRFYIVTGPASYVCTPAAGGSGRIERFSGYAFTAAQPAATSSGVLAAATRSLLVDGVSACSIELTAALANTNGVALSVTLGNTTERVTLAAQAHLPNTP